MTIIPLFPEPSKSIQRVCGECHHAALSNEGVFCLIYKESIMNERTTALECPHYEGPEDSVPASTNGNSKIAWPQPRDDTREYEPVEIPDQLVARCERYLKSKHISSWSQGFTLDDYGLPIAARWLAETVIRLERME